jgi:hypothetical protein
MKSVPKYLVFSSAIKKIVLFFNFLTPDSFCLISCNASKFLFNEIGIRVGHDRVNSALDVKGSLHKM